VAQRVYKVDKARKRELLSFLIGDGNWQQVLVFNRTKHGANRLAKQLESDGLSATAIHGNKSQGARTKALKAFKDGEVRVLVATDIAARGLDIDQLPHVVNFDLPNVPEDYVHRIGRTGRAGNEGEAISLVSADEAKLLRDIEKLIHAQLPSEVLPGYEPTKAGERQAAEAARKEQSNRRQRPNNGGRPGRNARRNGKPGGGRSQVAKPAANNGNRRGSGRSRTQSSNLADRILGPSS
jgi:ATP-dependent RNA helicase RhlE